MRCRPARSTRFRRAPDRAASSRARQIRKCRALDQHFGGIVLMRNDAGSTTAIPSMVGIQMRPSRSRSPEGSDPPPAPSGFRSPSARSRMIGSSDAARASATASIFARSTGRCRAPYTPRGWRSSSTMTATIRSPRPCAGRTTRIVPCAGGTGRRPRCRSRDHRGCRRAVRECRASAGSRPASASEPSALVHREAVRIGPNPQASIAILREAGDHSGGDAVSPAERAREPAVA